VLQLKLVSIKFDTTNAEQKLELLRLRQEGAPVATPLLNKMLTQGNLPKDPGISQEELYAKMQRTVEILGDKILSWVLRDDNTFSIEMSQKITDIDIAKLYEVRDFISELGLDICTNITDDVGLFIRDMKILRSLNLAHNENITSDIMQHLIDLPLEYLDLEVCPGITNDIKEYWGRLKHIKVLLLANSGINDNLLLSFDLPETLEHLSLAFSITKCPNELALQKLRQLKELDIRGGEEIEEISEAEFLKIKRALPDTKVI